MNDRTATPACVQAADPRDADNAKRIAERAARHERFLVKLAAQGTNAHGEFRSDARWHTDRPEVLMHVIGYIRVSTEEQERSGLGIEAQREAIRAEGERRGWSVEYLSDLGRSGKRVNPELRRALDLLTSGQADGLVVAKPDRLARSVRHASAIIDDALRQGWALVVLDNAIDLTTPGDRAMANMLATFAELERDLISTRTREALAARKARGLDNGRASSIPAGVLRRIVRSREDGDSFGRIAHALTDDGVLSPTGLPVWHESTVRRAYTSAAAKAVAA